MKYNSGISRGKRISPVVRSLTKRIVWGIALWGWPCFLMSCALLPAKREVPVEAPPEMEVSAAAQQLAKAEKTLAEGNLVEASEEYRQLALTFPQRPEAAKALLRQGEIEFRLERYKDATSWFQKVINQFPVRPEGDIARVWLLRCYLQLERFNDAVETGRSLMTYLVGRDLRSEAAELVGDAERAQMKDAEAVRWYVKAHALARETKTADLERKVGIAIERLNLEQLNALLAEQPEGFPSLRLQTRLVEVEMENGQLAMAQKRLGLLIEEEPLHPLAETWRAMADKVTEGLNVDMNTIGCLLPLSGRYQAYGDRLLRGLVMAAQDGKMLADAGRDIRLVIKDSGGDPDMSRAAVKELVSDHKVAAIIGPLSRSAAEAAAEEAQKHGVPIITLTQKEGVNAIGDYVFRYFLSNEEQTRTLVEYAVLELGYKRFALLYPNDGYGTQLAHLFWNELDRLGAEVRGAEVYEPSQTDFADQIRKLVGLYYPRPEIETIEESERSKETEPAASKKQGAASEAPEEEPLPILDFEAIFIPDSYEKVGLIAPQLVYYDVTGIRLLGTNLWNSSKLIEMAAPYLEGCVFIDGFFPKSQLPLTHQFVRRYEEVYGEEPGYPEAQAYDTLRLVADALRQPDVAYRPQLRNALLRIRALPGVSGTASVTSGGEVSKPPFLIAIRDRRMSEIQLDLETLRQRGSYWETIDGSEELPSSSRLLPMPEVPESVTGGR